METETQTEVGAQVGEIGILNVGAGHDKIKFDPGDEEGMKRAASVVKDMLKLGYAIFIENPDGTTERVKGFREDTYEYIVGPKEVKRARGAGAGAGAGTKTETGRRGRRVPVRGTRGVAVARTSGG